MAAINNPVYVLQNNVYPANFLQNGPKVGQTVRITYLNGDVESEVTGVFNRFVSNAHGEIEIDIDQATYRAPLFIQRMEVAAVSAFDQEEVKILED